MTTTETVTPRVWIGCLASYNAGRLIGEWCDATEGVEALRECQAEVAQQAIAAAKEAGEWPVYFTEPEEFFLADNEGFGNLIGEYTPLWTVADLAEQIELHGEAFIAYVEQVVGTSYAEQVSWQEVAGDFEEAYVGTYESVEHYVEGYITECGWEGLDGEQVEQIVNYIDLDAVVRTMETGGEIVTYEKGYNEVLIFRGNV